LIGSRASTSAALGISGLKPFRQSSEERGSGPRSEGGRQDKRPTACRRPRQLAKLRRTLERAEVPRRDANALPITSSSAPVNGARDQRFRHARQRRPGFGLRGRRSTSCGVSRKIPRLWRLDRSPRRRVIASLLLSCTPFPRCLGRRACSLPHQVCAPAAAAREPGPPEIVVATYRPSFAGVFAGSSCG